MGEASCRRGITSTVARIVRKSADRARALVQISCCTLSNLSPMVVESWPVVQRRQNLVLDPALVIGRRMRQPPTSHVRPGDSSALQRTWNCYYQGFCCCFFCAGGLFGDLSRVSRPRIGRRSLSSLSSHPTGPPPDHAGSLTDCWRTIVESYLCPWARPSTQKPGWITVKPVAPG